MKAKLFLPILSLFVLSALLLQVFAETPLKKNQEMLLRHVVLFKFKSDVSQAQIQEVADAFAGLPKKIDSIVDFEWGTDVSVENKSKGFTHCFLVTFATIKDRDQYLPHPAHKEFVALVGPRLADVTVVDYWGKN